MSSEKRLKVKENKKAETKITQSKPTEYKDLKVEEKVYCKILTLLKKFGVEYEKDGDVITSFQNKLGGLFSNQSSSHQLEALEFVISNKPKDMIEVHHLLNLFTVSDYMRMIGCQLHNGRVTHEQNQEYIKIACKTAEQYSKGMLTLKVYREGLPQFNKIQNNTLNQLNIHSHKEETKPKGIECKENLNAEKVAIKEKEEV